jgi:hypothetical protein
MDIVAQTKEATTKPYGGIAIAVGVALLQQGKDMLGVCADENSNLVFCGIGVLAALVGVVSIQIGVNLSK